MIISFVFTIILSYFLFSISKEDIKTMLISEKNLRIFFIFGILYQIYLNLSTQKTNGMDIIINILISMLIIFLLMYTLSFISYKLLKINSLGLGDIKLSSISTIWIGLEMSFISLSISFILSAIYSLYGKTTKRFKTFHQYPFAPFLSIGIFCSWILDKI